MAITLGDIGLLVLAILLPPLSVFLKTERFDKTFFINLLLTIIGWLPGQIHAVYVLITYDSGRDPLSEALNA